MIRLNKFFVAKGDAAPTAPLPGSAAAQVDADFASRLRRAVDRPPEPAPEPDLLAAPPDPILIEDADIDVPSPQTPEAGPLTAVLPMQVLAPADPVPPMFDLSQVAVPQEGGARRAGRVRTRLLGFDATPALPPDPIAAARATAPAQPDLCPVGWIVVTSGPGRGSFFALFNGVSQIGRGEDQAIKLDFGDNSISRSNHAAIAYDDESNGFFLGHGGKTNLVRLNDRPVISTETLRHNDLIRIGETTLMFVALCSTDFRWTVTDKGDGDFG